MIVKYLPFIRMFLEPLKYTFLFHVTHEETGEEWSCFAQGHKEVSEVLAGAGPPPSSSPWTVSPLSSTGNEAEAVVKVFIPEP